MNADTQAIWKNVTATKALTTVKKIGKAVGETLTSVAISAGISLLISSVVKFIDLIHTSDEEIREAAETARQEIDSIKESFEQLENTANDIKKRYAELAQGVDLSSLENLTLSTEDYEEFLTLNNQLAELFPTLTKNYDDNGNAILNLSGNVNSIVASLDVLIKKQRELANEEMLEKLPSVYKDYKKDLSNYTKELEDAQKKQQSYQDLYDKLSNADYEVSDNKREITFSFKDLTNEQKSSIPEYLTSNIDDVKHYLMKDLDNGITTATLYLEKDFDGFEARLESAYDDILKYSNKIKEETVSFNSYMNTWLQTSWDYQKQDPKIQKALQQVLFNKDWIALAEKELGEDAEWEQITTWIENEYINAIGSIEDDEIKQNFIDLFTLEDLTPEAQIDLAKKLQDYFDKYDIKVSLDFILNPKDPNSTQNLVDRVTEQSNKIAGSVDDLKGKYEELKKAREELYSESNYVGNVDINNRPVVTDSSLGGDYQTSYTGFQEFKNNDGTYEIIHFTPILPDGTVLDDNTLYEYLDNVIATSQNKLEADKTENGGLGILYKVDTTVNGGKITDKNLDSAFKQAENWDIQMHEKQASIYDNEATALIAYNDALEEHNKLNQYFKDHSIDTNAEYNKWLEITSGAENATQAMYLYDKYLKSIQAQDVDFFTEDNLEAIDEYKNKINDLSGYLEKINSNGKLSADDLSKLNTEYEIIAGSVDGYKEAIIAEMDETANNSEIMKILAEAITTCDDAIVKSRLEYLYETLQNINIEAQKAVTSFENLSEAISTLESSASLLRDLNE